MGILMFTARIHDLIYQKSDTESKLMKISRRIREMQRYSAIVQKGNITIGDLLKIPGSMMYRSMNYLAFSSSMAMQYMQQNAPYYQQMYAQQMGANQTPEQMQQMNNYIMRTLFTHGLDQAAQIETKNMNMQEEELKSEQDKLKTDLTQITDELKEAKNARNQEIKDFAPKYTAQG